VDEPFYKGFTIVSKVGFDAEEVIDLIFSRYSDMSFFMSLDVDMVCDQIEKAIVKQNEEKLWDIYLVNFSKMDKDSFESFEEFKKRLEQPQQAQSTTTVEEEYDKLKAMMKKSVAQKEGE